MKIQERSGAGNHRTAPPVQPPMGERLPTAPRERKPALAALAVLLILVGALGATMLVLRAGDRVEVVKVTRNIEAGQSVDSGSATSVMVAADDSVHYVRWSQLGALQRLKAKSTIYAGTVVVGEMFAAEEDVPAGKSSVGLSLKEGQYPAGLQSGDVVAAYRVGDGTGSGASGRTSAPSTAAGTDTSPIVAKARVGSVAEQSDSTISTGNLNITVLVDQADAAALAQAAAGGNVAIVLVPSH
ncbi:hypothetical protein AB0C59_01435 [Streptomyces sp. NPDC048664]|uniref:hypothetical protein n=1 Tax=Streptomyces sp. NPDC048664 TaxID=3154505 RepID=UPI00343DB3DF